jgi:hypothetical protein
MHQKAMKICTVKFHGCYQAQRVHGSKVEAQRVHGSKVFELDELKLKS